MWPGNIRELEQCVRSVLIQHRYDPPEQPTATASELLGRKVMSGKLTLGELIREYCSFIYSQTGSYQETARRLDIDHRTVKRYLQLGTSEVDDKPIKKPLSP